ncbi:hypothetical protein FGG08_007440 [Glutinoglossum americanum]|uniref:Uncharacterized protein n=1 Tax=Glutinoglossum americanum TaxID=1670608 RepID=A0A9P8HU78_9PEZI|nr:hypothetical protein FGG08_007440 [Glutinoglossum americanum]
MSDQYSYNGGDYYCLSTMVTPEVVQLITVTDGSASGLYTIITGPTAIVTPKTSGTSTGRAVMAAPFSVRWKSAEETLFPSRPPPQTSQTHNATSASSAPPAPTTAGTAPTAAGTATASSTAHRTLSNGAIAGVAIAAVVTVMLTTVALVYFLRRKRSGLGFAAAQIRPRKRKEEVPPASGSNSGGTRETTVANAPNYRSHGPLNLSALIPTELPAPGHVHSTSPALSSLDDHAPVSSPTSPQAPHSTPSQPSQSSSPLLATTTRTSAGRPLAEQLRELEAEEERLKELGRVAQRKREVLERLERGEE